MLLAGSVGAWFSGVSAASPSRFATGSEGVGIGRTVGHGFEAEVVSVMLALTHLVTR